MKEVSGPTLDVSCISIRVSLPYVEKIIVSLWIETATGGVLFKKTVLKISQYSQENTCVRASF